MLQGEMVTLPKDKLSAYLVTPEGEGKFPGLVVIHEAYGLNEDIKGIAERLAGAGYVALAVDLFAGRNRMLCMFRFFYGMLAGSTHHGGIQDLHAALDYLEDLPSVDAGKLGAIGFCMGGNFAICLACTDNRLKVVAPFYSLNPRPLSAVERACPVVGSFPEKDFTAGMGKKLDEALDGYKIPHDIKIYPDAKHSFFNHGGNHHPEAAQDAWERTLAFFSQHIGA
jgi:carboxymethylenebutenolidase